MNARQRKRQRLVASREHGMTLSQLVAARLRARRTAAALYADVHTDYADAFGKRFKALRAQRRSMILYENIFRIHVIMWKHPNRVRRRALSR